MALVMAGLDQWVPLDARYEVFLRGDPLTDPDYRVRLEVGGGQLEVRCLAPLPAGFWLRPTRLFVPPGDRYTTKEFRLDRDRL